MSKTNLGNQNIYFNFKFLTKAKEFNKLLHSVIPEGIYKGGDLTNIGGNLIKISTFSALLNIDNEKTIAIQTQEDISFTSQIVETLPYICINYVWKDSIDNYVNFEFKDAITDYDICFGKAEFSGGTVTGFDYTYRTRGLYNFDNDYIYSDVIYSRDTLHPQSGILYGVDIEDQNLSEDRNPIINYTPTEYGQVIPKSYIDSRVNSNILQQSGIVDDYILDNSALFEDYFFTNLGASKDILYTITMSDNLNEVFTNITSDAYNVVVANTIEGGNDHSLDNESGIIPPYHSLNVYSIDQSNFVLDSFFEERSFENSFVGGAFFTAGHAGIDVNNNDFFKSDLSSWESKTTSTTKMGASAFKYAFKNYVTGGYLYPNEYVTEYVYNNTDEYNVFSDAWTGKNPRDYSVFGAGAGMILNTYGYVFGGWGYGFSGKISKKNEMYYIFGASWSNRSDLSTRMCEYFVTDDVIYRYYSNIPSYSFKFTHLSNVWAATTPCPTTRDSINLQPDTNVAGTYRGSFGSPNRGYIFGGIDSTGTIINTHDRYTVDTDTWSTISISSTPKTDTAGLFVDSPQGSGAEGIGMLVGGYDGTNYVSTVDHFDIQTQFYTTGPSISVARSHGAGS